MTNSSGIDKKAKIGRWGKTGTRSNVEVGIEKIR
jgi:hypothetical protein